MTLTEAGEEMGIGRAAISRLLSRYSRTTRPHKHTPLQEEAYRSLYIMGLSHKETALVMKITPNAVSKLITKFLKLYPSLNTVKKDAPVALIGDWNRFDQTKIVQRW